MTNLELKLASADLRTTFWRRYVDDTCTVFGKNEVENTLEFLNRLQPNIEFAIKMEKKPSESSPALQTMLISRLQQHDLPNANAFHFFRSWGERDEPHF